MEEGIVLAVTDSKHGNRGRYGDVSVEVVQLTGCKVNSLGSEEMILTSMACNDC